MSPLFPQMQSDERVLRTNYQLVHHLASRALEAAHAEGFFNTRSLEIIMSLCPRSPEHGLENPMHAVPDLLAVRTCQA
jgi:hypothetical protein